MKQQSEAQSIEAYRGRIIRVVKTPVTLADGKTIEFETAERSPGVRVIITNGEKVLLMREWRHEHDGWDLRLPGGKVFDRLEDYIVFSATGNKMVEIAASAAKKEAIEETTLDLEEESVKLVYISKCGATVVWDLFFFHCALDVIRNLPEVVNTDEGEETHPGWFSLEEASQACLDGRIREDRTAAVLMRFFSGNFTQNVGSA